MGYVGRLALFAALFVGCMVTCQAPPAHWTVRFPDPYTDPVHVEAMARATDEWAAKTGLSFSLVVGSGDFCGSYATICVVDADLDGDVVGETRWSADWSAWIELHEGARDNDAVSLDEACLHEIGHALHLEHVDDAGQVMFKTNHRGHLTEGDLAQWSRVYTAVSQ